MNVKSFPGADCDMGNEVLSTSMRLEVIEQITEDRLIHLDFETVDNDYSEEVRQRFATFLQDIKEEGQYTIANRAQEKY